MQIRITARLRPSPPEFCPSGKVKVGSDVADWWNMAQNFSGKVTLQDLKPHGLLDLYRQGTTWVAAIRLKNGRLTNLPLEPTVVTRKAALQFLKAELEKAYSSALQVSPGTAGGVS